MGRASGRSILLMTTMGRRPHSNALRSTKRVCGRRPSAASTSSKAAVGHLEDALDLAAEVGVARRVDDVDLGVADLQGDVLGQDGDAALALQIVGVEDEAVLAAVELLQLFLAEQAGLAQHLIDQRGFAVIDVGDDRHIANVIAFHYLSLGIY